MLVKCADFEQNWDKFGNLHGFLPSEVNILHNFRARLKIKIFSMFLEREARLLEKF